MNVIKTPAGLVPVNEPAIVKNVTAPASGWSGDTAPYTNTIVVVGVTQTNIVEVSLDNSTATDDQVNACMDAQIAKATQANGSITLYAYGDKPSLDLPLTVIILN